MMRLRLGLVIQLRLRLWLQLWFEPRGGVCFKSQTTKVNIENGCFSIYTPLTQERRKKMLFFKQKVVLTSPKIRNFVWNQSGKEAMSSFPHIIPHKPPSPPPLRKEGVWILGFFLQVRVVINTKFRKFVCNHSGEEAMWSFLHIYQTNQPPWKRGTAKFELVLMPKKPPPPPRNYYNNSA